MITKEIVRILKETSNIPIIPFETQEIQKCIIYKAYPLTDDGVKSQYRVELRVIGDSLSFVEDESEKVKKSLITIGDKNNNEILSCQLSGGGILKDKQTNTIHKLMYFNITVRS